MVVKLNARVVLLKNLNNELGNGLCGTIRSFVDGFPCVFFDNGKVQVIKEELFTVEVDGIVVASRKQIPLDLAYAMTIHKSQGMSFDFLEVDLSSVFEPGQAHVAVSRAKTVEGLRIKACRDILPPVPQIVEDFYSGSIVKATEFIVEDILMAKKKCDTITLPKIDVNKCISVPSMVTEPQQFVVMQALPLDLPKDVVDNINVREEFEVGDDVSDVLKYLKLHEDEEKNVHFNLDLHINDFCKWLWCAYEQMHKTNEGSTLDRKKFSEITKQLHGLYMSSLLLNKWEECTDGTVDIGIGGKDRKAAVVYARAVYAEFLKQKAEGPRKAYLNDTTQFKEGPVHCTTNEGQGKLRDIAGWVISEEIKACISYVNRNKCSKSPKVVNQVERNRKIKAILNQLKMNKIDVLKKSKYPDTLEHAILYDKGGKTYVPDAVFEFFLVLSSLASTVLSQRNIHVFKNNVLSVAYTQILNNVELQKSFQILIQNKVSNNETNSANNESYSHEDALTCAGDSDYTNEVEDAPASDIGGGAAACINISNGDIPLDTTTTDDVEDSFAGRLCE